MACSYHNDHFTQQRHSLYALPRYQYTPLTGARDVRLFTLRQGAYGTTIRGSIAVADLDSLPISYHALSYTWGTSQPSHPIECDGCQLMVNCSLFSALNRLREEAEDRSWFVDFICINQSQDIAWLAERAAQVRLMDAIYHSASSVLIDLGDEPGKMAQVVLLMQKCCTVSMEDIKHRPASLDEFQAPPFMLDVWESFVTLCQRPWFQRIWVLQEYALAKTAEFMIGRNRYPEQLVMNSITIAFILSGISRTNREDMALAHYRIRHANTLVDSMEFVRNRHGKDLSPSLSRITLVEALKRTNTFDATDKRDRVYGLLGLINSTDMSSFKIDYGESVEACSHRLSLFLLQQGNLVDLFHTLACWSLKNHPSWMINLNEQRRPGGIDRLFLKAWTGLLPYKAGGREPIQAKLANTGPHLVLKGMIVDHVDILSDPFPMEPEDENTQLMPVFLERVREWDVATIQWVLSNLYGRGTNIKMIVRDYRLAATGGGHGIENHRALSQRELEDFAWDKIGDRSFRNKMFPSRRKRALDTVSHVMSLMTVFCESKRVGICKTGRLCSIPEQGVTGDAIAILRGFPVPFLLRHDGKDMYRLIGSVYLCRVMGGELSQDLDQNITLR